jgi:hypothetical protein
LNGRLRCPIRKAQRDGRYAELLRFLLKCRCQGFGNVRPQQLASMVRNVLRGASLHRHADFCNLLIDSYSPLQLSLVVMKQLGVLRPDGGGTGRANCRQCSGLFRSGLQRSNFGAQGCVRVHW